MLRIPILFGRALDERDRRDTPRVAVISETMARQYFGAANAASAVGRRFRLERDTDANAWIEVVGVARDTGTADLQAISSIPHRSCSTDRLHSGTCRQRPCSRGRRSMRPASSVPCSANCAP